VEPPASFSAWQKLEWIQDQMREANDTERAELLVRAAELYFSVERPESAGARAREAIYTAGSGTPPGSSVTSRSHTVLGAIALQRFDLTTARRELNTAIRTAVTESDSSAAYALLALVEEKSQHPAEADAARTRVRRASDPRVVDLLRPFEITNESKPEKGGVGQVANAATSISGAGLKVIPRANWKPNRIGPETDPMAPPKRITVHHEGKEFTGTTLEETLRQVKNIQEFHQRGRKWADIAYHYLIDPQGNIIEGRPMSLQGAHAGEKNKKGDSPNYANIGISLLGNFDVQKPTDAQEKSLCTLIGYLESRYGIPNNEIYTHSEIREKYNIGATGCPGKFLKPVVADIRRRGPSLSMARSTSSLGPD
jgi:hypothetical protein